MFNLKQKQHHYNVWRALQYYMLAGIFGVSLATTATAASMNGQVLGGGVPIAQSAVTLFAAGQGEPRKLVQGSTDAEGRFVLNNVTAAGKGESLYLVAKGGQSTASKSKGDNPAIALLTVLGEQAPASVTINEMTTVASVWTHNQFIDGAVIKAQPLQLKIAAGNVPSFVDLQTGGWGGAIQDPLNSGQTPTMANYATLANALAGCVTRVTADACGKLFAASTGPKGALPTDTLSAAQSIARDSWYKPERVFALLEAFYPIAQGETMRPVPYMPYLQFSPSAWVLPLKFDGGGYRAGGKAMFDAEGNLWRLAGQRCAVAGQREQVRPQRQAAVADHHRLYRRRHGGWYVRRGNRPEGQCLAV